MATALAELIFVVAVIAIGIAQAMILRSTRRGMSHGSAKTASLLEWGYAVLPAVALVLTLAWTWRTMHDVTLRIDVRQPAAEARP